MPTNHVGTRLPARASFSWRLSSAFPPPLFCTTTWPPFASVGICHARAGRAGIGHNGVTACRRAPKVPRTHRRLCVTRWRKAQRGVQLVKEIKIGRSGLALANEISSHNHGLRHGAEIVDRYFQIRTGAAASTGRPLVGMDYLIGDRIAGRVDAPTVMGPHRRSGGRRFHLERGTSPVTSVAFSRAPFP